MIMMAIIYNDVVMSDGMIITINNMLMVMEAMTMMLIKCSKWGRVQNVLLCHCTAMANKQIKYFFFLCCWLHCNFMFLLLLLLLNVHLSSRADDVIMTSQFSWSSM